MPGRPCQVILQREKEEQKLMNEKRGIFRGM